MKSDSKPYLITSIIFILIPLGLYFIFFNNGFSSESSEWGNFGSYIGGVASAFLSFLTILLIIRSFDFQQKNTQSEKFENSFFTLLALHKDATEKILGKNLNGKTLTGYSFIEFFKSQLEPQMESLGTSSNLKKKLDSDISDEEKTLILSERASVIYEKNFQGNEATLGHYFRSLYHIMKFIDQSPIEDKSKYASFVQAFLTDSELYILFYNGISKFGKVRFKELIDTYNLLENINSRGKFFELQFEKFYPKTFLIFSEKQKI